MRSNSSNSDTRSAEAIAICPQRCRGPLAEGDGAVGFGIRGQQQCPV